MNRCRKCGENIKDKGYILWCSKCRERVNDEIIKRDISRPLEYYFRYYKNYSEIPKGGSNQTFIMRKENKKSERKKRLCL